MNLMLAKQNGTLTTKNIEGDDMACSNCNDYGFYEMGGYDLNCDSCKAGFDRETNRIKRMIKHHQNEARKLSKILKKRCTD